MATVNFLYRSTKENAPLNIRLLFRYNNQDYTLGAKTNLLIFSHNEQQVNNKLSAKNYWAKEHFKTRQKDISLANKQTEINTEINQLQNFVLEKFCNSNIAEVINTKNWLKDCLYNYYNPKQTNIPVDLIGFIDYYINAKKNEINEAGKRRINVTKHKMQKLESKLRSKIYIKEINENFKSEYVQFCNENQYSQNTQQRELILIKTICYYAKYLGIETHYQLDSLKLKRQEVKHVYLTEDEISKIENLNLEKEHLNTARDWLLISCFTGQRVSDFMRFKSSMIRCEEEKFLIEFKQVKTQKLMTIPLSKKVREILKKRNGEFPSQMVDQKYNQYIKIVCEKAEINELCEGKKRMNISSEGEKANYRDIEGEFKKWELVTSHIGRRSFATNYYGKIPTSYLINITGHSSEKMFLNYIKKSNKDIALDAYDFFN